MAGHSVLFLVDTQSGIRRPVAENGIDIVFPSDVRGWSDVLDCRFEPFVSLPLSELTSRARGVRKYYLLLPEDRLM